MIKKITLILFLVTIILLFSPQVTAKSDKNLVNIYMFHSNTCPHCKEEIKFLNNLEDKYDNIKIYKYEIHDDKNLEILEEVEKIYNDKYNSVPIIIIGNELYLGFAEKSKIKFIKTIDYFSKYGYEDKLGKYLNLELPKYKTNESNPTLDNFIKTYHNYNLLGLNSDDLDTNNISLLLGLLLGISIPTIIGIIIFAVIIIKITDEKAKILTIALYVLNITILLISSLIKSHIMKYIAIVLLLILVIYNLLKFKKKYLILNYSIIIPIILNIVLTYIDNKNILIFKNILKLHNIKGLELIYYYGNCVIIYFAINTILIYLVYIILNKIVYKKVKL